MHAIHPWETYIINGDTAPVIYLTLEPTPKDKEEIKEKKIDAPSISILPSPAVTYVMSCKRKQKKKGNKETT